jgi:hypothetical protein
MPWLVKRTARTIRSSALVVALEGALLQRIWALRGRQWAPRQEFRILFRTFSLTDKFKL